MTGEAVTVERRVESGRDPMGNPVYTWSSEEYENVLCAPTTMEDSESGTRPDADEYVWTLFFPKGSDPLPLRGCNVVVRGERYRVSGDPQRWDPCPTDWDVRARAVRLDG